MICIDVNKLTQVFSVNFLNIYIFLEEWVNHFFLKLMGWLYVVLFWVKSTYLSHNITHCNYNDLFLVVSIRFYYYAICKNKYIGSSNLVPRSLVTRDPGTRLRLQIQEFFSRTQELSALIENNPFRIFPCCLPFTLSVVFKWSTF